LTPRINAACVPVLAFIAFLWRCPRQSRPASPTFQLPGSLGER
jgi:hypothetical protein